MRQHTFATALLDRNGASPAGLVDPQGRPAPKRFAVYRNNVAVSLTEALEQAFPVVRQVVGEAFFAAMAGEFLRAHPPRSAILMAYGEEFPGFMEAFPPVADLGYLPDLARLEQALRESYHAADGAPITNARLTELGLERLLAGPVHLAPALRLVASDWPVLSIWAAHAKGAAAPAMRAEAVLILRPEYDPEPFLLPEGGEVAIRALSRGDSLGAALALMTEEGGAGLLSLLLAGNAIMEREDT